MKRIALWFTVLLAATACAQDWAKAKLETSPRHGEWVQIKHGDRTVHAFVVYPETKKKAPVVIVIHEIFGLTDWARTVADELAANGYIAIAPDLLSGAGPNGGKSSDFASVDDARGAIAKLDPAQITADLNAVADYARKVPAANRKLAVAGFCWGGAQSFRFATDRKDLRAAFVFYGAPPRDPAAFAKIAAPVYGFYAGNDERINAMLPDAAKAMQAAGKTFAPMSYKGAGHGFMRAGEDPSDTNRDNKTAHDAAWKRWLALLRQL